ncbi:MAG: hypothetical protein HY088_01650 [Ignavibacteriales bacterium]|nr:hypothetical protein [Ignavibacteriales bacterium]
MTEQEAQQELAFIKKVMSDSRRVLVYDGKEFITWGVLTVVGMLIMYFAKVFDVQVSTFWLWGILIGGGWLYSLAIGLSRHKSPNTKTFGGTILGSVWLACGIAMTLIGFVVPLSGAIKLWAIIPLISMVSGVGYFITGVIHGSTWIRNSSLGWWLGAVIMLYWPGSYMFLFFAGMMVAFQIIPGVFFYRKWKQEIQSVSQ